jgi:hypothetical protein
MTTSSDILKNQFIDSEVSNVGSDNIIKVKIDIKESEWKVNTTILEGVKPILNYPGNIIKEGDRVLVFSSVIQEGSSYYYIPKQLIIPLLKNNGLLYNESNKIIFENERDFSIVNNNNRILMKDVSSKDELQVDTENLLSEGSITKTYLASYDVLFLEELKADINYKNSIIEIISKYNKKDELRDVNLLNTSTVYRIIDFTYNPDDSTQNSVTLNDILGLDLNPTDYDITYKIYKEYITSYSKTKGIEIISDDGLGVFLNAVKDSVRNIKIATPSVKMNLQEDRFAIDPEGTTVRLDDKFFKLNLTNFRIENKTSDEAETERYDSGRPLSFEINNVDYDNPSAESEEEKRTRNQSIDIKSIKHRLRMMDTSGIGADLTTLEHEYLLYSSIGGNYLKLSSEKDNEEALTYFNRAGVKTIHDSSQITTEQHKSINPETLQPAYIDPDDAEAEPEDNKPINKFSMNKNTEAENIVLESHSSKKDLYETLKNKINLSETAEESSTVIENTGAEKDFNKISLTAKEGEGSIKIENMGEDKSNSFSMTTAGDVELNIDNTFADGKTNSIKMTKDLIKISSSEDGVVIEISKGGMKITTEKDLDIESSGNVNVKGTNVNLEGAVTLKTGDSSSWSPNILPNCLYTGAPHGGSGGGINKLKGG